jgi:CRP-like cAMP-binding protein
MRLFNQNTKVEALKAAPLFQGLSKKELTELARQSEDLEVSVGHVLTKEGDTGQEFFVLVEGTVDVTVKGKSLGERGAGEFLGEIALLEDTKRTATVTAKTPLRLFVLTRQDFRRLVDQNPDVERKVLQTLARRIVDLSSDPTVA